MKKTENGSYFKNPKFKKITDFMSKYSVYGVFALMLIAVIALTLLSLPSDKGSADSTPAPTRTVDKLPEGTAEPSTKATVRPTVQPTVSPDIVPEKTPVPSESPVIPPNEGDITDVRKDLSTDFRISLPFDKKKIITKYSDDTPVYSETLNEWACHVGIDFECLAGENVPAAANGVVKEISEDDIYGISVLIEHQDGFTTLYRGLETVSVKQDELVAKNQNIGTALSSLPYEAHLPAHIHFEVQKNGLSVNPMSFEE